MIKCPLNDYRFDPDKSALENLFAMIYRNNPHHLISPDHMDASVVEAKEEDEDNCNSIVILTAKAHVPVAGEIDIHYARADIEHYYPEFEVDLEEAGSINSVDALIHYLDGKFNLVDGEFEVDIEDPFHSLHEFTQFNIKAVTDSYIYIGEKTITVIWTGALRRVTDEGELRVTEDGQYRIIETD